MKMTHVIVEGQVQGVFFRESTRREASHLDLSGWVRNVKDGTVEVMLAGPDRVAAMLDWLKRGSPRSRVDKLRVETIESDEELTPFAIRYDY